jgi:hypothetical protein
MVSRWERFIAIAAVVGALAFAVMLNNWVGGIVR